MKYAVIKTGGKQYRVAVGETLSVEKLDHTANELVFSEVLMVVDGDKVEIGTPFVKNQSVYASVIADVKGDKLEIFKFKSKSRYRKHTGHRQQYTQIKIEGIGTKPAKTVAPKAEAKVTAKPVAKKVVAKKAPVKKAAAKKPAAKKAAK